MIFFILVQPVAREERKIVEKLDFLKKPDVPKECNETTEISSDVNKKIILKPVCDQKASQGKFGK